MADLAFRSLDDESFSDFTIRCKDRDFKVHRVILAGYDYFKGAFSNFKVSLAATNVRRP